MSVDDSRIPVIVGIGEVNDRPAVETEGLDSLGLMLAALRHAEQDAGVALCDKIEWLGVVDQISFPDPDIHQHLGDALPRKPDRMVRTPGPMGDSPLLLINDAANLIGAGEIGIAALAGGEAMRTAMKRAQAAGSPPSGAMADAIDAFAQPMWRKFGLLTAPDVYPLFENAGRAARHQSLAEAQAESAEMWSHMSKVAADNPGAWLREAKAPDDIITVSPQNRMISFPYTKLMAANNSVNQGAALLMTSVAVARELGISEDRFVYVGRGAAAHEPDDFLARDQYAECASITATVRECLKFNGLQPSDIDLVEFYSCFPCVPKMIRRVLDWPLDAAPSVYGGLTFGGGPIANCMMHAAVAMVRGLRGGKEVGLIVANGGHATHSHSIVLRRQAPGQALFPQDYDVQTVADALRGVIPPIIEDYTGPAAIETYSVPFDRSGAPARGVIIGRTPNGARVLAHVPAEDRATLEFLTDGALEPVGSAGQVVLSEQGDPVWRRMPS